jgi:hypothetical protein
VILLVTPAQATDFVHFDQMNAEAQSEYVAVMIDAAENVLRAENPQSADQMQKLFTEIKPGDSMPLGLIEFGMNEDHARVFDAERYAKDHNAVRVEVEHALFITLKRNNIVFRKEAAQLVFQQMAGFHPATYAEFEAKTPASQRQFVALLVRLAYPDFRIRDAVERKVKKEKPSVLDSPEAGKRQLELIAREFPSGSVTAQTGFTSLAKEIEAEYRKNPNDAGPFYSIIIHMLKMMDADALERMKKMEDSTYHTQ